MKLPNGFTIYHNEVDYYACDVVLTSIYFSSYMVGLSCNGGWVIENNFEELFSPES